jgi:hypothetical protein
MFSVETNSISFIGLAIDGVYSISNTIIPSSEINVSDKMAVVDDLRPTSPKQLQSSEGTLIIEYTPSIARPM